MTFVTIIFNSRINSYARVEDSILFDNVEVGRYAKIRRAIIGKGVRIPAGIEIGYDPELDRSRGFTVSDRGKAAGREVRPWPHLHIALLDSPTPKWLNTWAGKIIFPITESTGFEPRRSHESFL